MAIAEGGSQAKAIKIRSPISTLYLRPFRGAVRVRGDVWPYGIEANRCTLEAFTQFCFEQGVADRRVPLSELFPPQLTKTYKA